jgi:hypothetical protein
MAEVLTSQSGRPPYTILPSRRDAGASPRQHSPDARVKRPRLPSEKCPVGTGDPCKNFRKTPAARRSGQSLTSIMEFFFNSSTHSFIRACILSVLRTEITFFRCLVYSLNSSGVKIFFEVFDLSFSVGMSSTSASSASFGFFAAASCCFFSASCLFYSS